ncbi:MAG TPA: response regulator [Thermomicrobiaceae bacterium]|nr:response regulator [Thermomicrobiaceae bacterium]
MSPAPVLIIDDDEGIRDLVALALGDEGYQVVAAANGAAALDLLRQGQARPGVILLDTRMPVMDGAAFASAYRAEALPHAPIILLTAAADADTLAGELEADAVLQKPFDLDDLLGLIARFNAGGSPSGGSASALR